MIRLALSFAEVLTPVAGPHWLPSQSSTVTVEWMGHVVEIGVFGALVLLATTAVTVLLYGRMTRQMWRGLASLMGRPGAKR